MDQKVTTPLRAFKDKESGKWGFKNNDDEVIVPPTWRNANYKFSEGLCPVVNDDKRFGFVDETGNLVIPCNFVHALDFRDGLARVQEEGTFKIGYINKKGETVNDIVKSGEIGDVRLYRISFGFPMRAQNDFRYNKALGGGALLDCGGYTLKYASMLLGPTAKMKYAQSNNIDGFNVDMYGSAALVNDEGVTAQVAFGMDHNYKCELEVWGSKGTIYTNRILTAPAGFVPEVIIRKGNDEEKRNLPADDAFKKSILHFSKCIEDAETRRANYETLLRQARLVEQFKELSGLVG